MAIHPKPISCIRNSKGARDASTTGQAALTRFPLIIVLALVAGGCAALFPPLPPDTPVAVAWRRYQACVNQSQHALAQCQNLRTAYEAQLNRAQQR